jgi:primosomal replication protein N
VKDNEVVLAGELVAVEPLRYTPAGVPRLGFRLLHRSSQTEAGARRKVECELSGISMAEVALAMAGLKIGDAVTVRGFLNRRSRMSTQLVLHATATDL